MFAGGCPKENPEISWMIRHTGYSDLVPCGDFLDEKVLFNQSTSCAYTVLRANQSIELKQLQIPKCYFIPAKLRDVLTEEEKYAPHRLNYIDSAASKTLGFFQDPNEIFIVENDIAVINAVYKHEVLHSVYSQNDMKDENHSGILFKTCSTRYIDINDIYKIEPPASIIKIKFKGKGKRK